MMVGKPRLRISVFCGAIVASALLLAAPAGAAVYFHSPSGNIGCGLARYGARCDIRNHSWRAPPKPRKCHQDWGGGLTVGKRGKGEFFCAGDTVLGVGRALPYGRALRQGRFICRSRTDGMRCVNVRTRHGFRLSMERAIRF